MIEIYKPIKGFENLYKISNLGNIQSLDRIEHIIYKNKDFYRIKKGKLLKKTINTNGYYYITLHSEDGSITTIAIHRLVASHFLDNPNSLECVNHKDENKLNNNVDNLEWCSYEYNNNYGIKKEKLKVSNKWRSKEVVMLDCNGNIIKEYLSMCSVKDDGFDVGAVFRCCNNKQLTHKNNIFKYKENVLATIPTKETN